MKGVIFCLIAHNEKTKNASSSQFLTYDLRLLTMFGDILQLVAVSRQYMSVRYYDHSTMVSSHC